MDIGQRQCHSCCDQYRYADQRQPRESLTEGSCRLNVGAAPETQDQVGNTTNPGSRSGLVHGSGEPERPAVFEPAEGMTRQDGGTQNDHSRHE